MEALPMKRKFILVVTCLLLVCVLPAQAQFTQDPDDLGTVDTVELALTVGPDANTGLMQVQVYRMICSKEYAKRSITYVNC